MLQQGLAAQASVRVREIIEAAERTAAAIVQDAEAQAQRYLEEARIRADQAAAQRSQQMSAMAGDLIERTEAVKRQSNELLQVLDETKRRLDQASTAEARPATAAARPAPPPSMEEARTEPNGGAPQPNGSLDGARLLTTQMAVAGSSRAEIESRLRNEFGIEDTAPMLDAILGREE